MGYTKNSYTQTKKKALILFGVLFLLTPFLFGFQVRAQESSVRLLLSPKTESVTVGDTFDLSVYVGTGGQTVNAIEAELTFPPNKLQIVAPSVGKSVLDVWVGQPSYSNVNGTIGFRGTILNPGLNTTHGLISTMTFRVRSTGKAVITFTNGSKVLLNDGKGTNVLSDTNGATLELILPPQRGPVVYSPSHPDQTKWYKNSAVSFTWDVGARDESYSYVLDQEPVSEPDNVPDPNRGELTYGNVADGVNYFHIKAYRNDVGVWGGVSHYAVNIDKTPPAQFSINIEPGARTTSKRPIITFYTSDASSGFAYYEVSVVSLEKVSGETVPKNFFVESSSPYIPELVPGKYDVIVRAHDYAGNIREIKEKLTILTTASALAGWVTPPSSIIFILLVLALILSAYLSWRWRHWHKKLVNLSVPTAVSMKKVRTEPLTPVMANKDMLEALREKSVLLQEYQKRYGHLALAIFFAFGLFLSSSAPAQAALRSSETEPPLVLSVPSHVQSDELFYISGVYPIPGATITIYLQNDQTGETSTFAVVVDKKGNWFYSHPDFLNIGSYTAWTQATTKGMASPPSAQVKFSVDATALSVGSSRISFELVYLSVSVALFLLTILLLVMALYYYRRGRNRHEILLHEIKEAEEAVHLGFAIIRRDIEAELGVIKKLRMVRPLREEEETKHRALLDDMREIESTIDKQVTDIQIATGR